VWFVLVCDAMISVTSQVWSDSIVYLLFDSIVWNSLEPLGRIGNFFGGFRLQVCGLESLICFPFVGENV